MSSGGRHDDEHGEAAGHGDPAEGHRRPVVVVEQAGAARSARPWASSDCTTSMVSTPSTTASGTCVMAKTPANFASEPRKPPPGSGNAQASWTEVVR